MKVLYCDCFSGISGDMLLGALIDAGVSEQELRQELAKLGLEEEYRLCVSRVVKKGISATDVQVELIPHSHHNHHNSDEHHHNHSHEHEHKHEHFHNHNRNLFDIAKIIDKSTLEPKLKAQAKYIFQRLGKAEAKVHGTTIDKVHFHEVGAVDAIIDICGVVIGLALLGIDKVISSSLPTGSGFIECAHGTIPVPAPATVELLQNVPVYDPGVKGELVTPTGAALITSLAEDFGAMPAMNITSIGYGAGNKDFGLPNVLRVFVGEAYEDNKDSFNKDVVFVLETTIDDCSPEILGYLWDKIFETGALDMYYTPVYMKKGRPASLLTVITTEDKLKSVTQTIFNETSTIGLRASKSSRFILEREIKTLETAFGKMRYKVSGNTIKPEFDDLKNIAEKNELSIKEAYIQAMTEYKLKLE